jgi:peptidoglycan/LPS O-acetylase OafA/YrhL
MSECVGGNLVLRAKLQRNSVVFLQRIRAETSAVRLRCFARIAKNIGAAWSPCPMFFRAPILRAMACCCAIRSNPGKPSRIPSMSSDSPVIAIPTRKSSRIVELDSLRALAAINLVLFHFTHVFSVKYGYTSPLGFEFPWGKYGVQLFFMLSGLVNAMTLMKKRDPSGFIAGRIIRICPSFWSVIAINLVIIGLAPLSGSSYPLDQVAANLTIVPGLLGYSCIEPVTWTLQVEVLFYGLILLLFLTGSLERPVRTVAWLLTLSAVTCLSINYLNHRGHQPFWLGGLECYRDFLILEYLPLFTIGILLNEIKCGRGSRLCNGIGIAASMIVFHAIDNYDHNPAATVILFALLAAALYGRAPFLRFRPLVWVSTISYALYLLHNNVGCVFIWHVNQAGLPPVAAMLAGIVFVTGLSAFVTYRIEQPLTLWLRNRWSAIRKRSGVAHSVPRATV